MNKRVLLIEHTSGEFIISRLKLGTFLMEKGYRVAALVPEGNQEDIKRIEASGIEVFTFPYKRNMTSIGSTLKVISLFRKLFKKHQFDIIHSFKFQPNFYAALARLFLPKNKLVLHITGLGVVFTDTNTFKIKLLRFISRIVFLFCFIVAEKLIFQNPDDEKDLWLTSFFKHKHSVIKGSGVNIEKFDKRKYDVQAIRKEVGVEEDKLVLTFISRLVQQKGIYEVVAAVKNLAPEFPKMRLHVVGNIDKNSPESITQDFIDEHQDENINFLGRRKDIAELLAITDLYVFPSYYREGLPRTCLEALATGLPIITTNMPGCNLCIDEGLNGYLIEPKSIEKVENAIRKICTDNSIERMGLHSRKIAEERFQNKLVYQQIEEKYREMFADPS